MKPLFFNRKSLMIATLLASSIGANAQIVSTHTDEKFNYTTVVYKDKASTDKDVLTALDNSIGMGDVIRVTVAPPKPAAVPTIDKSKGEDVWLKTSSTSINTLTATTTAAPIINKPATAAPKAAPVTVAKATPVAAKPVVKQVVAAPKAAVTENQNRTEEKVAAAPKTIKTKSSVAAKSTKSSKKAVKKSVRKSSSSKMKSRKKGKQRYGCPKF